MNRFFLMASVAILFVSGCSNQATQYANSPDETSPAPASHDAQLQSTGDGFALNSENTRIEFVGTHVGEKPDPRKGNFKEFSGSIGIEADKISSIAVEIDAASLETEIEKLTTHLKSPDFFDVRKFPKITFQSTNLTADNEGQVTVTGELTLMGVTKQISFPAKVDVKEGHVNLKSNFEIDRTEFGMNYGPDKVEKIVTMTVSVGD